MLAPWQAAITTVARTSGGLQPEKGGDLGYYGHRTNMHVVCGANCLLAR